MPESMKARIKRWAEIVVVVAAAVAVLTGALPAVGLTYLWPGDRIKATEATVKEHGEKIERLSGRLDDVIYISCETLQRVNPTGAVPPRQCPQGDRP